MFVLLHFAIRQRAEKEEIHALKAGNTRPASPADLPKKVQHILAGVLKRQVLPTDFDVNKICPPHFCMVFPSFFNSAHKENSGQIQQFCFPL